MKQKKIKSSIVLFSWFLAVIIFLSAWNANRFVGLMSEELPGITPENAKIRTDRWDSYYTKYFRFMQPLSEVAGVSYIALGKRSVDNYEYIKDENGNMQFLEESFDRALAERQVIAVADAFEQRGIPFVFVSMPPRFDKENFAVARELDIYGQRDEKMLETLSAAGIETLDTGQILKDTGKRYMYPLKTDIHLQTEGEFEAAKLIVEKLRASGAGFKDTDIVFDKSNYDIRTLPFAGNLVKSSGTVYTGGRDMFDLWYPRFDTDFTVTNPDGDVKKEGAFAESIMNGMDTPEAIAQNPYPYLVLNYLQYPSAYYTVENNKYADGCKLLFIIDSYAIRTAAYLSLCASQITVIDPRGEYGAEYLAEAMESGEYDAVVFASGGTGFYDNIKAVN